MQTIAITELLDYANTISTLIGLVNGFSFRIFVEHSWLIFWPSYFTILAISQPFDFFLCFLILYFQNCQFIQCRPSVFQIFKETSNQYINIFSQGPCQGPCQGILGWHTFSFIILTAFFHYLLASIISGSSAISLVFSL